jgi:hypothetical protein
MSYRIVNDANGQPALQHRAEVAVYVDGSGERQMSHVGWETIASGDAALAEIHATIDARKP